MPIYTLAQPVHAQLVIRKSQFIGQVQSVVDRAAAMDIIGQLRHQYPDATHVCWALLAGGQSGMSDDGEPSGTAGRPMLEVLRHHHLDGVLATVVRYYGGIQLGAGGLVRAYTDTIASALKLAVPIERIEYVQRRIDMDYADESRIRRWLIEQDYVLVSYEHHMQARFVIELPFVQLAQAAADLSNLSQGRAILADI